MTEKFKGCRKFVAGCKCFHCQQDMIQDTPLEEKKGNIIKLIDNYNPEDPEKDAEYLGGYYIWCQGKPYFKHGDRYRIISEDRIVICFNHKFW